MHILNNDPEVLEMLAEKGVNAEMIMQPANSPDTNLLYLPELQTMRFQKEKEK